MNQPSGQARPSRRPGEHSDSDTFAERHCDSHTVESIESQYLRDFTSSPQGSGALHGHHGIFDQVYGNANDFNQYHDAHIESHNRQASAPSSPFAQQSDHVILRGIQECAEATSPRKSGSEASRRETAFLPEASYAYKMPRPRRSESDASGSTAPPHMQSFPHFSIDQNAPQDDQVPQRKTKYPAYASRYADDIEARNYRRKALRFDRQPYKVPEEDPTIVDIESNRNFHVMRIYNAMTSCEFAKDNPGSPATKRWVNEAHYDPKLVEAYAHKVFDCMLQQVRFGFRGWIHNDYVADERKGDDIDKDVECAGRLDNIIMALEQEKTVCEDVMNSACQIRMFVNAPRAYANRKHQNRVGNSKRGRTKDTSDANSRPTKAARTTGGRRTRARSTTASELPSSRDTTPQQQQSLQLGATHAPYYRPATGYPNISSSPSIANQPAPRSTPMHRPTLSTATRSCYSQYRVSASSPPPSSTPLSPHAPQLQAPRMTAISPHQHSSSLSQYRFPHVTPATPEEAKPGMANASFDSWYGTGTLGESSGISYLQDLTPLDPALSEPDLTGLPPWAHGDSSSLFDQGHGGFVNPAVLERQPMPTGEGNSGLGDFPQF